VLAQSDIAVPESIMSNRYGPDIVNLVAALDGKPTRAILLLPLRALLLDDGRFIQSPRHWDDYFRSVRAAGY
jgi:hypothetical protein